jgi:hypothetical protein
MIIRRVKTREELTKRSYTHGNLSLAPWVGQRVSNAVWATKHEYGPLQRIWFNVNGGKWWIDVRDIIEEEIKE